MSEAAGVNSAAGSFGLSFGLAFAGAIMLATLSVTFTNMADAGLLGLFNSFRVMRLPDPTPSVSVEGIALG